MTQQSRFCQRSTCTTTGNDMYGNDVSRPAKGGNVQMLKLARTWTVSREAAHWPANRRAAVRRDIAAGGRTRPCGRGTDASRRSDITLYLTAQPRAGSLDVRMRGLRRAKDSKNAWRHTWNTRIIRALHACFTRQLRINFFCTRFSHIVMRARDVAARDGQNF